MIIRCNHISDQINPYLHQFSSINKQRLAIKVIFNYLIESQYFVDLPWTKKFGNNQKRDQIEIVFSGLTNVHIPAKFNLMDCLQSANIGVYLSHDESLNVKEENKVKCVAWERHIYN